MHKIATRWDYVCEGAEWFGLTPNQGNTHEMKTGTMKVALLAALSGLTFAASAAELNLATPSASEYPDTESSVNVAVTNWPALGRRVKLTLSADFTPSNGVQVALGQDSNADGDLAPEETHLVLGVDCGEPFVREEFGQWRSDSDQWRSDVLIASEQEPTLDCQPPPPPSTFTFAFKQPSPLAARLTHAKITTRGRGESAAQIAADAIKELTGPGEIRCGAKLAAALNSQLATLNSFTVVTDETLGAGFTVRLDGGRVEHDFTAETISTELAKRLRPDLAKLVVSC